MNRLKGRVIKLEKGIRKRNNNLVTIKVISLLDRDWREYESKVIRDHMAKHGSLDGLMIVRSRVPLPGPPPPDDLLNLIHNLKPSK